MDQQMCLPTPASWHYPKGENAISAGQYNNGVISNHAAIDFSRDENIQYKQCRDGYLNNKGLAAEVTQGITTKTAINRASGKASDGQLFTYAYIEARQTFTGWIDCDDDSLINKLKTSLNQIQRIGRSRNTEFGRIKLSLTEAHTQAEPVEQKTLTLWCLSDCEMLNAHGLPTFSPEGKDIHPSLANASLNSTKSFIRTTRVSRFNQKRQGADSEQLLIAKGSVLVYTADMPIAAETIKQIEASGIGINKHQGLGWVQSNPQWANHSQINGDSLFHEIALASQTSPVFPKNKQSVDSPLLAWVNERITVNNQVVANQAKVHELLTVISSNYKNARAYNNIINSNEAGPSSTQWRRIADKVRSSNQDWTQDVFVGEHAICKADNDELGWGITWHNGAKLTDFATETKILLEKASISTMRLLLEQLCRVDLSTYKGLKDLQQTHKLNTETHQGEV
jgi:CRISPR-associated protein Csx10